MRPQKQRLSQVLSMYFGGLLVLAAAAAAQASPPPSRQASPGYKQDPGPSRVEARLFDWTDAKRGRSVPVKIYFPADAKAPAPLIVLSHGLGGSREGYEYLGRHWAGHGYISLHIQHIGSDDAVPMSAPVPRDRASLDRAFGKIAVPCLHMTGTLDDSPIGETRAADRRLPFDHTPGPGQYLIIFEGGDHMIFSGRARAAAAAGKGRKDALFQDLISQSSTAFWDAYLRGDGKAEQWLAGGGFEAALGANGTFEMKPGR